MILIQITLLYAILIRSQLIKGIVFETRDGINFAEIFLQYFSWQNSRVIR